MRPAAGPGTRNRACHCIGLIIENVFVLTSYNTGTKDIPVCVRPRNKVQLFFSSSTRRPRCIEKCRLSVALIPNNICISHCVGKHSSIVSIRGQRHMQTQDVVCVCCRYALDTSIWYEAFTLQAARYDLLLTQTTGEEDMPLPAI